MGKKTAAPKKRRCTVCNYTGFMTVHYPVQGGPIADPRPSGKLTCPRCGKTAKNHMIVN